MDQKVIPILIGKKKAKKWNFGMVSRAAVLIVSFFVVGYALTVSLSKGKPDSGGDFFRLLFENSGYSLLLLAVFLGMVLAEVARFTVFLYVNQKKIRPILAVRTVLIGRFYSAITPFLNGGQSFQTNILSKAKVNRVASFSIPSVNVFLKLLIWNFILLLFLIFNKQNIQEIKGWAYAGLVFSWILPILFFIFSLNERLAKKIIAYVLKLGVRIRIVKKYDEALAKSWRVLEDLHLSVSNIIKNLFAFLILVILYAAEFFALMSLPYLLFRAAGETVTYGHMLVSYMYVYLSASYVPTPGAAGAYEVLFFAMYGGTVQSNMLYWLMITIRFFTYFFYIFAGYFCQLIDLIVGRVRRKREMKKILSEHLEEWKEQTESSEALPLPSQPTESSGSLTNTESEIKVEN
ncbi:MAG: flippase-like domain-containing protein [Clostridiales bacterium]|jgi:uncharacterized membrane protein YbhN (UPF0104 family)|nr:flippase-like domain-containing protein [Clostridiales bacterium]